MRGSSSAAGEKLERPSTHMPAASTAASTKKWQSRSKGLMSILTAPTFCRAPALGSVARWP
eukprot:8799980-Alexandrium_andersonii.AAC.1